LFGRLQKADRGAYAEEAPGIEKVFTKGLSVRGRTCGGYRQQGSSQVARQEPPDRRCRPTIGRHKP